MLPDVPALGVLTGEPISYDLHKTAVILVNRRWNGTPYRRSKGTPLSGEF